MLSAPDHHVSTPPDEGRYLDRVQRLLADWFLVTGADPAGLDLFRHLTSRLATLPPAADWRFHSALCGDGSPVEVCETLAEGPGGPAYTCDPGPYGGTPADRLDTAVGLASHAFTGLAGWHDVVRDLRRALFPDGVAPAQFSLWLGADHPPRGSARLKLYFNLNWRDTDDAWRRAGAALTAVGCRPDRQAQGTLNLLSACGYPKQLALTATSSGRLAVKLYFRLGRADLDLLAAVAASAGMAVAPFAAYLGRLLRRPQAWSDPNAGIGVALASSGAVAGVALYHYVRPYFGDDEDLRQRVLAVAAGFGWDVSTYRSSSRLISVGGGARLRSLMGFTVKVPDGAGLRVYARTGHLAA